MNERNGIMIAGNILCDIVKNIDVYPEIGMLSNISSVSRAVGGCVPNTAINLAKIASDEIKISAAGKIGNDDYGKYAVETMEKYGIGTENVSVSEKSPTSFSDVMNLPSGERTFFHARGANREFSPSDIDTDSLTEKILHIGYILLLDRFDEPDEEYGTVMARFLHDVKSRGIKTSIDSVSDSSGQFGKKIIPVLKYCSYAIMNEIEGCTAFNISPRKADGSLDKENIYTALRKMAECGVEEYAVIHSKEAAFILDAKTDKIYETTSVNIPKELIKGSVGAGDAFCAATLYGIYKGYEPQKIIDFASAAAVCNLFAENSIDGMLTKPEIEKIPEKYGRK